MEKENNNQYIIKSLNKKRNLYRLKLGVEQMIQFPLLNILLFPIIVMMIFFWSNRDFIFVALHVSKLFLPIFTFTINILGVLIPLLLLLGLVTTIGSLAARKDEARVQMAFKKGELRNGSPILISKKKDKKSGVIVREFYSLIPMKLWKERREEIADAMNIHFVQDFRYGGKSNGNRIVMYSVEGREPTSRGPIYDEEF